MIDPIIGTRNGLAEFPKLMSLHFNRLSFVASFVLDLTTEMPNIRYITTANCVTSNDDEDARIGKESRCNCLFLGQPIRRRRRPVEEAVTSELF